jgi:GT2 family glycosyltransferase
VISFSDISVVIPTFGREEVLVDTISSLLSLNVRAGAVLVIDQTPDHDEETICALTRWSESGDIRWELLSPPSIPCAMNTGLIKAEADYVLFLDDDIIPDRHLISAFVDSLNDVDALPVCVAGQIIQPDEEVICLDGWNKSWFPFNSDRRQYIDVVMAGNLCVNRRRAIQLGGFDENFKGSAYCFESEFARRVTKAGGKIMFEPSASMRHLRAERGGTRAKGHHLTTWRPHHSVGKYYYAFLGGISESVKALLIQPLRAVRTKHHLRRPWWIPVTLLAEMLGIAWAFVLLLRGPRLLGSIRG